MRTIVLTVSIFSFLLAGAVIMFDEPEVAAQNEQQFIDSGIEKEFDKRLNTLERNVDRTLDSISNSRKKKTKVKVKKVMPEVITVAVPVNGGYKEVEANVYKGIVILPEEVCPDTCTYEMPVMIEAMVDTFKEEINWRQKAIKFITAPFKK